MDKHFLPEGRVPNEKDFNRLALHQPGVAHLVAMRRRGDIQDDVTMLYACCLYLADLAEAHQRYALEVALRGTTVHLVSSGPGAGGSV